MGENESLVFSIPEAGRLLGVSRPTAYQMAHNGQLPVIQTGTRKWVVPKAALMEMLENAGTKK